MSFVKQEYEIIKRVSSTSNSPKTFGTPMITIFMRGVEDRLDYRTYVVRGNRNEAAWQSITESGSREIIIGFVRGKMKKGTNIIDADSKPYIIYQTPENNVSSIFN
jgi:hypothetical protein